MHGSVITDSYPFLSLIYTNHLLVTAMGSARGRNSENRVEQKWTVESRKESVYVYGEKSNSLKTAWYRNRKWESQKKDMASRK